MTFKNSFKQKEKIAEEEKINKQKINITDFALDWSIVSFEDMNLMICNKIIHKEILEENDKFYFNSK